MIVDEDPQDTVSNRIVSKSLKEAKIDKKSVYFASFNKCKNWSVNQRMILEEIEKVKPRAVIAMGKEVIFALMLPIITKKAFSIGSLIGSTYKHHNTFIIPSYDAHWIMNRGKAEWAGFQKCLQLAEEIDE